MVTLGKHKADAKLFDALGHGLGSQIEANPGRFEYVRRPAGAGHAPIAVLRHPGAALGDVVADSLRGRSSRYTTQEMAWGIRALAKRVQASSAELPGTVEPSMVGTRRYYQYWYLDPADPFGAGLSNALEVLFHEGDMGDAMYVIVDGMVSEPPPGRGRVGSDSHFASVVGSVG